MFQLFEITREVRIEPHNLGQDRVEAVSDELNKKFSNRVVLGIGLCMSLWDIKEILPGIIYPGDGGVHCTVKFRYIAFRPFQDEIIVGKIKRCTPDGVHVSLGFFDDIFIPQEGLQHPSKFDEREQIWIWEYKTEDDDEVHEMYMDKGESIRFRITDELFCDTTPVPSAQPAQSSSATSNPQQSQPQPGPSTSSSTSNKQGSVEEENVSKTPYSLTASINEPGLGLLSWWS